MNAVTIPQAVKRWTGRCMAVTPFVVAFACRACLAGILVALAVWGAAFAMLGLFIVGMKWGFDE